MVSEVQFIGRLKKREPVNVKDLRKAFSFRFMSRREREVTKAICLAINARVSGSEYKSLVEQVRKLLEENAKKVSILWLTDAEILAMAGGLFVLAGDIRQLTVRRMIKKYEKKKKVKTADENILYICYMSLGENEKAAEVFNRARKSFNDNHKKNRQWMHNVAKKEKPPRLTAFESESDKIYAQMIEGKNIAIIGPSAGELDVDEILCDFDVKILLTYRSMDFLTEEMQKCGVDVSYYNSDRGGKLSEKDEEYFEDLKMIVFKSVVSDFQKKKIAEGKARKIQGVTHPFLFKESGATMLQRVLADVFCFSPARVKVFNANMVLSNEKYYKGYDSENVAKDRAFLWCSCGSHNIICNYEITRFWHGVGYFEADEELTEILTLGTKEYLHRFEQQEQ